MSLSPVKSEILGAMLLLDKPERAVHIAKEVGIAFPSVMMHIIGLTRMGYLVSPEKGLYILNQKGKKALGIPEINNEEAKTILSDIPQDKAFHFYADLGKPLGLQARSLQDFCDKLSTVTSDSITFHLNRGDFQSWFSGLGDIELAKKVALLEEKKLVGDQLRKKFQDIIEKRCIALSNVAGHATSVG
jgi:hypothetical protein